MRQSVAFSIAAVLLAAAPARASGIATHMFHAEIGLENVTYAEVAMLAKKYDTEWRSATSFPDGGYPSGYPWAEESHWVPFAEAYLNHVKARCEGRYLTNKACGKLVMHFLGAASHGFGDEVVDALLMPRIAELDGSNDDADAFIDFFTLQDFGGRPQGVPQGWFVPYADLDKVHKAVGTPSTPGELLEGAFLIGFGNFGEHLIYPFVWQGMRDQLPWAYENYYTHRGGVLYIGLGVAKYLDRLWERLNGVAVQKPENITPYPEPGQMDVPTNLPDSDTQIGAMLDRSFVPNTVTEASFIVRDEFGHQVDGRFSLRTDPASGVPFSRMIRFHPHETLLENTEYTVTITPDVIDDAGMPLVPEDYVWTFTTGEAAAR